MMWWLCHLISQWGVGLNTSDLTQLSGLITRITSDLCQARQKYPCTVRSIIGLRDLPPRMKNQHGLNEEKTLKEKNNLSIESSEVNVWLWLVWIPTTKRKSLTRLETCQKKHFTFWLFDIFTCYFRINLQTVFTLWVYISFWCVPHWTLDCSFVFEWRHSDLGSERIPPYSSCLLKVYNHTYWPSLSSNG